MFINYKYERTTGIISILKSYTQYYVFWILTTCMQETIRNRLKCLIGIIRGE